MPKSGKPKGGYRPGAGRKPGAINRKTQEIALRACDEGLTPVEYLLAVMRDESNEQAVRIDAAKAAAPYCHPRLQAVEHSGKDGGAIPINIQVEFV